MSETRSTTHRPSGPVVALIAIGALVAVLLIGGLSIFGAVNSAQRTGTAKEAGLSAQYKIAQTQLSTLIGTVKDSLGVADIKSAKIDQIISDAIAGRGYTTKGAVDANLVISAVHEAYPDMTPLNSYDQVITAIQAGRQSFADQQNKLQDMIRDFDTWRKSGLVHREFVTWAGIPDDTLKATIGTDTATGAAALDRMSTLVLSAGTSDAYKTGTLPPLVSSTPSK